ncbi:lysyl oxidase family protein [Kineosporia mesophila]|uniref:Lysyl oxidase family protein n=1 Tax=Kineosporia mesophila TaxID=566012 RepID=A0ABP6Z2I9_9ACTN|nr:lysyl oxidase family protein [Kineosporia mesophila]MCD5354291.1 hypothetical protein [Kineosporia mesophila]
MKLHRALIRLTPVLAVVLAAGTVAAVRSAEPAASATAPVISFELLNKTQTVQRAKGEAVYFYGLGFYAVARDTLEFRTHKGRTYADPVRTTLKVGDAPARALPAGITTSPNTLTHFFDVKVTNSAGKKVKSTALDFCPNSWDRNRVRPDAPATSPYPEGCGYHPFTISNVLGVTGGWSTPVLGEWDSPTSFKGPDGTYTVRFVVTQAWRKALGLTLARSTQQLKVKVKTVKESTQQASAMSHTQHGMNHSGDLSPQMAAMEAGRQRALGEPSVPASGPPSGAANRLAAPAGPGVDLRSRPAYEIAREVRGKAGTPRKTYLNFSATVWNAGPSPLVVDGFRQPGHDVLDAYQYFFDQAGNQVGYTSAGQMQWDPRDGHNHWHFKAFASYRLLDQTQEKAIISGKEAFCLAPTDAIDLAAPGAQWQPASTDLYTACGQGNKNLLSIREVLESGWGDTYGQYLPGQSFNITRVPSGTYFIQTIANPDRKLTESNYDNNAALRKVRIGGKVGGVRTVKVYPYQGVKD